MVNAGVMRLPKGALDQLREFVNQGGGLVVLGGYATYDNGGFGGTPLEEMLPVSLKGSYLELYITAEKGAKLSKGEQADWPMRYDFSANPIAYYYHILTPKPGAKIQVKVGNQAALVSGTFGKGRVVACALTVNGNPPAGVTPFWEWKDWPAMLAQAVEWAEGARPPGVPAEPAIKPLTVAELQPVLPKDFAKRAAVVPDQKTAAAMFELAAPGPGGKAICGLDVVLPAILPYANADWPVRLTNLTAQSNANLATRQAALTLLGACRAPSAYAVLTKAFDDKKTETAAIDGLGWLGNPEAIPILKSRYEETLKPTRLPDGPDRWDPLPFADASPLAAHLAIALYRLGDPDAIARLADLYRVITLHQQVLWNDSYRSTPARLRAQTLDIAWEFIEANDAPIPPAQGNAFVKYAATVDDPVGVELLAGILEKSTGKLPGADWKSLAKAQSGIIAKMSQALSR
jgi:hypothetical protein